MHTQTNRQTEERERVGETKTDRQTGRRTDR